jgi:hypothetical protein
MVVPWLAEARLSPLSTASWLLTGSLQLKKRVRVLIQYGWETRLTHKLRLLTFLMLAVLERVMGQKLLSISGLTAHNLWLFAFTSLTR